MWGYNGVKTIFEMPLEEDIAEQFDSAVKSIKRILPYWRERTFLIRGFNMDRKNIMGSEVVDGFACKPKRLDPNRPIMHYKTHIFVCQGDRWLKNILSRMTFGKYLRGDLKELKV